MCVSAKRQREDTYSRLSNLERPNAAANAWRPFSVMLLLGSRLETGDKRGHEAQMFSRKAIDFDVSLGNNTVFERKDSTQKQLHKGKWIQSEKRGDKIEKNKQNICFHIKTFKIVNEEKKDEKEEDERTRERQQQKLYLL